MFFRWIAFDGRSAHRFSAASHSASAQNRAGAEETHRVGLG